MSTKKAADGTTVTTRSTSEGGHVKNATGFKDMLTVLTTFGNKYNPANELIQLWVLERKNESVNVAMTAHKLADQQDKNAENERNLLFAPIKAYSTRVFNALASSTGVSDLTLADARLIVNKIQGGRSARSKKAIATALETGGEAPRTISVSQQSFDQKVNHWSKLCVLVAEQPGYKPNEEDLKLKAITEYEQKLIASNNKKVLTGTKLKDARNTRNFELYDAKTGVIKCAELVKSYVLSLLHATHPDYKKINIIPFRTIRERK
ncbi:MAG: hypothetical protein WC756_16610 [Taibaiella sp.]|jgi:hypothetical protein